MAKSRIIKDLANEEISLEIALNRLLIIASDIENDELMQWVENELNGYDDNQDVPEYRIVRGANVIYSGLAGNLSIQNAELAIHNLFSRENPADSIILDTIEDREIREGIKTVEKIINEGNSMGYNLMPIAGMVLQKTGIQCTSIRQIIPSSAYEGIVSNLKTVTLKLLLELDKILGNLDELDVSKSIEYEELQLLNKTINNYIYIGNDNYIGNMPIIWAENGISLEGFKSLKEKVNTIAAAELSDEQADSVSENLNTVEAELSKEKPRKQVLRKAIDSIKTIKESAEFAAAAAEIVQFLHPFLG